MAQARGKTPKGKAPAAAQANDDFPSTSRRRPVWEGHLKLSFVSCPVSLYRATTRTTDISFHLLNPETNNRIRMGPIRIRPVERADLVSGYEVEKDRMSS